ncbi:hypothetical protein [Oscillatoria salina]|uniref:hypothetical protein n=1 Tax=Oscillatoria salina TaxID=331517 RepID=UPI001CCCB11D|nr:hypothetical protein [Oscillatoria salina]MBZ8179003.1 hypothetical protein [Oscillatoria salina IIICB1]
MKSATRITLATTLASITAIGAGFGFAKTTTASPTFSQNSLIISDCSRSGCTSYRANYEDAIAQGIIERPSLVADENEAVNLARQALDRDNKEEAARRLAQALVIISEAESQEQALAAERALDAELLEERGQTLRETLPLFGEIFPLIENPYS